MSPKNIRSLGTLPHLPTELWLQILEYTSIEQAEHLWLCTRQVSTSFKCYVERLFITTYLTKFSMSLSLPRRDPSTGALKWWGAVPNAHIVLSLDRDVQDQQCASWVSPSFLSQEGKPISVEELKDSGVLPQQRLKEAPAWVFVNANSLTGVTLCLPNHVQWDEGRKAWRWTLKWKHVISQFYKAKIDVRSQRLAPGRRQRLSRKGHGRSGRA